MARLVGYMANRADRLEGALHQERAILAPPRLHGPSGWGLGFYQGGEVLHKKRPRFDPEDFSWSVVARGVVSDCAVLHLRDAKGGHSPANTHPFRSRQWLFAHLGELGNFAEFGPRLRESIPEHLRRGIRGTTDSEVLFHVFLSFLFDAGLLEMHEVEEAQVVASLRSAISLVDHLAAEVGVAPPPLTSVLTNGRSLYAVRRGLPMAAVERYGLIDAPEREYPSSGSTDIPFRYVMVVGGVEAPDRQYTSLDESSIFVVHRDLTCSTHSL